MNRNELCGAISAQYGIDPEFPFEGEDTTVFRRRENRKWFALLMRIPASRLGLQEDCPIDVLNLKCDPILIGSLIDHEHIFPAYHMNKSHWISIRPDHGIDDGKLAFLIDRSYQLTASRKKKK